MAKPLRSYKGQSSAELPAAKKTHDPDSELWALGAAIQAKHARGQKLGDAEAVVAAVLALHREAHAKGLRAFLSKSAEAEGIVERLTAIGATKAAAILSAQAASKRKNLDEDYFALTEVEPKLWAFIERNRGSIDVQAMEGVEGPSLEPSPIEELYSLLEEHFFQPKNEAHCRKKTRQLAACLDRPAGEEQIEGAALWFLLGTWIEERRFDDCAEIGERVLALAGSEAGFEFLNWAEALLEDGQAAEADRWAAAYLRQARPGLKDTAEWDGWHDLLRQNKKHLPQAALAANQRTAS